MDRIFFTADSKSEATTKCSPSLRRLSEPLSGLPGLGKHINVIFILANRVHENWIIADFLFGGDNLLGQLYKGAITIL